MELASMLAGEPFTDHPVSVCPVIGSFLRAYNDSIDDRRRQDLYAYASRVVGSRASTEVQRLRAARLSSWSWDMRRGRLARLVGLRNLSRMRTASTETMGVIAVRSIGRHTCETHTAVLALVNELLQIGTREGMKTAVTKLGCAPSPQTPERTIVGAGRR
jgi:hypothetical protein